jgi:hypothetical protein
VSRPLCGKTPGCLPAAIGEQQVVDGLTVPVDCPVQVMFASSHGDGGFVHAPGEVHWPRVSCPALLEFRHIARYPAENRRMGDGDAALGHHLDEIAIAEAVSDVPPDAELNSFGREPPSAVDRVSLYRFCHSAPHLEARILGPRSLMQQSPIIPAGA